MLDYSKHSITELFEIAKKTIYNIHKNVLSEEYKDIEDEEHQKIKVYTAINRINMYIATNILALTFYTYDLKSLHDSKKRAIIKIIEGCKDLTYKDIRESWYQNGLKELFYKQKEEKKYSEELANICIIARNITQELFIRIDKGNATLVKNLSEASEFIATSKEDDALESVSIKIKGYFPEDDLKVFFNNKMAGRLQTAQ
jgi:hypothetical protein